MSVRATAEQRLTEPGKGGGDTKNSRASPQARHTGRLTHKERQAAAYKPPNTTEHTKGRRDTRKDEGQAMSEGQEDGKEDRRRDDGGREGEDEGL